MRILSLLFLLLAPFLLNQAFVSGRVGRKFVHQATRVEARSNAEALRNGMPLPRPKSIPMRCARNNATCIELNRMGGTKVKRQANPSQTAVPQFEQQFQLTCTNTQLTSTVNPSLTGTCKTQTGTTISASYQLSKCVSYQLGGIYCALPPSNTNFANQCNNCVLSGTRLTCNCGIFIKLPYSIDLATCVGNVNGVLQCKGETLS